MESTDKLRRYIRAFIPGECEADLLGIADEIEREIAERYMELPVDADGVPIRVGDVVTVGTAHGFLPVGGIGAGRVWFMYDGVANFDLYENVRHVKPRTIEDVLREFASQQAGITTEENDALIAEYADELRSMGVGE